MQIYVEQNCTITHNGHECTAGGAVVTDDRIVAYPAASGILCDWHGNRIGSYQVINSRRAVFFGRYSWQGSRYYYMRATLDDGRRYSLRGFGIGMIATGRRIKSR